MCSKGSRFTLGVWGKLQNISFLNLLKVSEQVAMSFCVAGAALCDISTCLIARRKSFCVAGALLLRRFNKMSMMSCSFRGRRNILEISVVIWRGRRSTSDVSHCVLYTPHSTPQSTLYTSHSTLYIPHTTLYTLHSTHTPHFTLHTPHFTFHTSHSTLYTLYSHFPLI